MRSATILLVFLLALAAACGEDGDGEILDQTPAETNTPDEDADSEPTEAPEESTPEAEEPTPEEDHEPTGELATVINVVDGDTIDVLLNGIEERVRYIGINSPENESCYSEGAADINAFFVEDKLVLLEREPGGDNRDRFDRLLRYIWTGDVLVNEEVVRAGGAEATTNFPEDLHRERLLAAQAEAQEQVLGVWDICGGDLQLDPDFDGLGRRPVFNELADEVRDAARREDLRS